jgi:hypothetical protein
VDDYIQKAYILAWLRYPGANVGENYLGNIKTLPYSILRKTTCFMLNLISVKVMLLQIFMLGHFYFCWLEAVDGQYQEIIMPSFGVRSGELTLLHREISSCFSRAGLFSPCIVTGRPENKRDPE